MPRKRGNNLRKRYAQVSLPRGKIPRSFPSLPATLSSFGHFYHGYHNYSTRFRTDIRKRSPTYDIVYSLCRIFCLRFMSTIFLSITCCSDLSLFVNTFLKLQVWQPVDSKKSRLVSMGIHGLLMVKYTAFFGVMCHNSFLLFC